MKYFLSILLITLFIYSSLLYYAGFHLNRYYYATHNNSEITAITIPTKEITNLKWIKKNKEFIYNNKLYDIEKIEYHNKYNIYFVRIDENDLHLIKNILYHFDKQHKKTTPDSKKTKSKKHVFFTGFITLVNIKQTTKKSHKTYQNNYKSLFPDTNTPPPVFFIFS